VIAFAIDVILKSIWGDDCLGISIVHFDISLLPALNCVCFTTVDEAWDTCVDTVISAISVPERVSINSTI